MCNFFSFVTEPENHGGRRFYTDWKFRQSHRNENHDSHSSICRLFDLNEDLCNKYEYNPITKIFLVDQINSSINDCVQAEEWVRKVDFKKIIEPLIVKDIVSPFQLPKVTEITDNHIKALKNWYSVRDSVRDSVWYSIRAGVRDNVWSSVQDSVRDSVRDSVWGSVQDSVRDSPRDSVWDSVQESVCDSVRDILLVQVSSFFCIKYGKDFSSAIYLWDSGILPSFDGITWRLHSGIRAEIIFSITTKELLAWNSMESKNER